MTFKDLLFNYMKFLRSLSSNLVFFIIFWIYLVEECIPLLTDTRSIWWPLAKEMGFPCKYSDQNIPPSFITVGATYYSLIHCYHKMIHILNIQLDKKRNVDTAHSAQYTVLVLYCSTCKGVICLVQKYINIFVYSVQTIADRLVCCDFFMLPLCAGISTIDSNKDMVMQRCEK